MTAEFPRKRCSEVPNGLPKSPSAPPATSSPLPEGTGERIELVANADHHKPRAPTIRLPTEIPNTWDSLSVDPHTKKVWQGLVSLALPREKTHPRDSIAHFLALHTNERPIHNNMLIFYFARANDLATHARDDYLTKSNNQLLNMN